jgi:hypothetical protein
MSTKNDALIRLLTQIKANFATLLAFSILERLLPKAELLLRCGPARWSGFGERTAGKLMRMTPVTHATFLLIPVIALPADQSRAAPKRDGHRRQRTRHLGSCPIADIASDLGLWSRQAARSLFTIQ